MFERLLKLYVMAMTGDVRSPMPHLVGPPGTGKSTIMKKLADHVGVKLHIMNVSRISPLELEGVQMPIEEKLKLLIATYWTQLNEGDIYLWDEFLRGMPEVYNGLLDIMTSREIGGHELPPVFIIGASNSTVAYDRALEDRLLHIPVPDPRSGQPGYKGVRRDIADMLIAELGLMPAMAKSGEMESLLVNQIIPTYSVMDQMMSGTGLANSNQGEGKSLRNLIGQAKLREVTTPELKELIDVNNLRAMQGKQAQHVLLLDGKGVPQGYESDARALVGNSRLSKIQATNLNLNLQLIEMESTRKTKGPKDDEHTFV